MARLTLWGIYQYDPTLFDLVVLPDGYSKPNLIDKIMRTCGELYPYHQVPPMLKINITGWFATRYYDFESMYKALNAVYNPIENYDRTEDKTLNHQESGKDMETTTLGTKEETTYGRKDTTDFGRTDTTNYGRTDTTDYGRTDSTNYGRTDTTTYGRKDDLTHGLKTIVTPDTETISENSVAAFDSNALQRRNQDIVTASGTTDTTNSGTDSTVSSGNDILQLSGTDSTSQSGRDTASQSGKDTTSQSGSDTKTLSGTDTVSNSGMDKKETDYGKGYIDTETIRAHGNIGVTSNQQMITQEMEMRIQYDLYAVICAMFEKEFLVQVY